MYLSGKDPASLFGFYLDVESLYFNDKDGLGVVISLCDYMCTKNVLLTARRVYAV